MLGEDGGRASEIAEALDGDIWVTALDVDQCGIEGDMGVLAVLGERDADIDEQLGEIRDDVQRTFAVKIADIENDGLVEIVVEPVDGHGEVSECEEGVAPGEEIATGVGCAPVGDEAKSAIAFAVGDEVAVGQRGLENNGGIIELGGFGEQLAAGDRADFLIGIQEDFAAEACGVGGLQPAADSLGKDKDAAFHIGSAGAVNMVADNAGGLEGVILGEDGVEVSGKQDFAGRVGVKAKTQGGADVDSASGDILVGRQVDAFEATGEVGDPVGDALCHLADTIWIGAAGVGVDPVGPEGEQLIDRGH